MILRTLPVQWFSVLLVSALFTGGCAFAPVTGESSVEFQAYDLPDTLDSNAVILAVERSFARTLAKPPRIVEGSVPSPLPAIPAQFRVEERLVHLDRLGMVRIPNVVCPENMAVVQVLAADKSQSSGPHSYMGCIQRHAGGYRVSLIASRMVVDRHGAIMGMMDAQPNLVPDLLARIGKALREEVSEARLVDDSRAQASTTSVRRTDEKSPTDHESSAVQRIAALASPAERSAAIHAANREENAVSTLPLVCLAPKHEFAPVRAARGEGGVLTLLDQGSTMAVAEPIDAAYFRVKTEDGTAGWVNRADVRRLPCPIG